MRFVMFMLAVAASLGAAAPAQAGDLLPPETPIEQAIDHYVDLRLTESQVTPAPPASDANVLRRTMLDLAGRPALLAEARQFVESQDGDKRVALVDRLLASPGFVRHQAAELDSLLKGDGKLESYLQTAVEQNRPWSEMFRELLLGQEGDAEQKGAIRYVRSRADDLDKLTNDASVAFFGVNVSCAKCHDHPLVSDWSQDHYYGMYAFFSRTFENGEFAGERDYGQVEFKTTAGEMRQARPMFLTGFTPSEPEAPQPSDEQRQQENQRLEELKKNKTPPPPPAFSRRQQLVDAALADDERRFFARAMVNHQWKRFYGIGLVHPSDQMHTENEPSHPELLDWLARDFLTHGYDLKRLTRGLVLSQAYCRTSAWSDGPRPSPQLFTSAEVRPLSPRQYAAVLKLASANPDSFPAESNDPTAAIEAASQDLARRFELVGDDFQVGAAEALLMSNSEEVERELLADGDGSLAAKLNSLSDDRQAAETAIWAAFGRPAEEKELATLTAHLAAASGDRLTAIKQLTWALLASSECRFNY